MSDLDLIAHAVRAFEHAVANIPGMRSREGQKHMVHHISRTLGPVTLGENEQPVRGISVVHAGTGVGKSLAYAAPCIALAQAKDCRLILTTATVALQEQLARDLPLLSKAMPKPFKFALVKGRGRYFCALKGERLSGGGETADDLFDDDERPDADTSKKPQANSQRISVFRNLAESFASGKWDGDRDALNDPPAPADWAAVAADRHSCSGKSCAHFNACSYYRARRELVDADVLVANHDLLLSSLGMNVLPGLRDALICIDEAHHLPAVSLSTFADSMDLTSLRWLDRLPKAIKEAASRVEYHPPHDVSRLAVELKAALGDTAKMILEFLGSYLKANSGVCRFQHGVVPEFLYEPLALIKAHSAALLEVMRALAEMLRTAMRDGPALAQTYTVLYSKLGAFAPKLEDVASTSNQLLDDSGVPLARWVSVQDVGGFLRILLHASPITPGEQLAARLWSSVRGAVLTSATLKSCGSFDFFLSEAGLADDSAVSTLEASSPFDYEKQGRFIVVDTVADPKNVPAFNAEVVTHIQRDLAEVTAGALVLFTSRAQMAFVLESLPADTRADMLVQGEMSRASLLREHGVRVRAGRRSIIAGLASFGTGVDLPGELLTTLCIMKMPFSPPSDPIGEARSEWLETTGRNAFEELVVPETGVKMLQWTGRAIRTETDTATVICYDRRMLRSGYGNRILRGMPPYSFFKRSQEATVPLRVGVVR